MEFSVTPESVAGRLKHQVPPCQFLVIHQGRGLGSSGITARGDAEIGRKTPPLWDNYDNAILGYISYKAFLGQYVANNFNFNPFLPPFWNSYYFPFHYLFCCFIFKKLILKVGKSMYCQHQGTVSLWELFIPRGSSLPCDPKDLAGDRSHGQWGGSVQGTEGWWCCKKAHHCPFNGLLLLGQPLQFRLFGAFGDAQAFNIIDFLYQWSCCCHPSSRKPVPADVHPTCFAQTMPVMGLLHTGA